MIYLGVGICILVSLSLSGYMYDGIETESHTNIHRFIVKTFSCRYRPVADSRDRTVDYTFSFISCFDIFIRFYML